MGLDVTNSYGYHFDPFDSKRQFITYTDIGLFRSEDGGTSWMSSTAGVPRRWVNTTYWMVFDPEGEGTDVEREQRHARSSASEDVAAYLAAKIQGRRLPERRRRQELEEVQRRHGGDCRHPYSARSYQPGECARAIRRGFRARGLQEHGRWA